MARATIATANRRGRTLLAGLVAGLLWTAGPTPDLTPGPAGAAPTDLEDWERYIEGLNQLAMREPDNPSHHLRLAEAYSQIGDSSHVEDYCRRAQDHGAPPPQVYALLGEHYLRMGRFPLAFENLQRAVELGPRSAYIHVTLWKTVLAHRRSPVPGDPVNPVVLRQAIGLLSARGYYVPLSVVQEGEPYAEDLGTARTYLAQGYGTLRSGNQKDALLGFQAAADWSPTLADAYRGMGIVLARLGQADRAFAAYQLFLALDPQQSRDVEEVERILLNYYQQAGRR